MDPEYQAEKRAKRAAYARAWISKPGNAERFRVYKRIRQAVFGLRCLKTFRGRPRPLAPLSAERQQFPRLRLPKHRFCRCGAEVRPRDKFTTNRLCDPCREIGRVKNERRRNKRKVHRKGKKVEVLHAKQRGRCFYCLKKLNGEWHVDHFVARARGGRSNIENLRLACPACNIAKSDKPPEEFLGVLLI